MFSFYKYNYDTDQWMDVPAVRQVQFRTDSEPELLWQDLAACGAADPDDFEPAFLNGTNAAERTRATNEARFRRASEICKSCPVLQECKENATNTDMWYTYRAGEVPGIWEKHQEKGRIVTLTRSTAPQGRCKNGHDDWAIWGGRPKCRTCDRNRRISGDPAIMAP